MNNFQEFMDRVTTHYRLIKFKKTKNRSNPCDLCEGPCDFVMWFDDLGSDGPVVHFCDVHRGYPTYFHDLAKK